MFYKAIIRPLFFSLDPERVHNFITDVGGGLGRSWLGRWLVQSLYKFDHPSLKTSVCGIEFKNPVGLAAGFDKNIRLTDIIPEVGFGFMEVGAITQHPSPGNSGRRLARLVKDKSILVYYGLNNIGADAALKKVKSLKFKIPAGINIAKTNRADIKGDWSIKDYIYTYRLLSLYFSYVTINVSCPNVQDGCTFQRPDLLDRLLKELSKEKKIAPIFLKFSNHLSESEVNDIISVVGEYNFVDGFILSNLSKDRDSLKLKSSTKDLNKLPLAGVSGSPIKNQSTNLIKYVYQKTGGKFKIIGVGGIFSAEDAYEKIRAGASLIQIITGLIYEGPGVVFKIKKGLVRLLKRDGFKNISEAVGADFK